MTDTRVECWKMAQECLTRADEILVASGMTQDALSDQIPALVTLNMQRAQILATLSTVPYDAILSGAVDDLVTQQIKHKRRKQADEFLKRMPRAQVRTDGLHNVKGES